ncbi:IS66 family transposase [Microcoleus sp. herbarium5]|uniref:IS66 family transposase n=1 Tax=Microcoleus sp. herbarium5 TaxID=3055434 RepID=UPI003B15B85D
MGVKEWLWTASGKGFCLFHAADTRGRVELETMLGKEFAGVLSSDDFSVYNPTFRRCRSDFFISCENLEAKRF